jgi:epoxyqueuosine reductase
MPGPNLPEADAKPTRDLGEVWGRIEQWALELGFEGCGVSDVDLASAEAPLLEWLDAGFHGGMGYMARHGSLRARPTELVPGTVRVLTFRVNYLPRDLDPEWRPDSWHALEDVTRPVISWYARGRDYHKVIRKRLQALAVQIEGLVGPLGFRVFTDSAPVLEVELGQRSGLGWRGKHTLLLSRDVGSMFFLGEIFVDLPFPVTPAVSAHCGRCTRCIDVCPTQAILAPYRLDARRCISYLTIEHDGAIPVEFRRAIGNRIYGCDDCQLVCPWNKFAERSTLSDFDSRQIESGTLVELFRWSEDEFKSQTAGSAIGRIGHERWLRNIAVALGNALATTTTVSERGVISEALAARLDDSSEIVREHIQWALEQSELN